MRHVIEHIKNPMVFMEDCNRVCEKLSSKNIDVLLFMETPDFNWILKRIAFEDIVYEHCSFFTPNSIAFLLQKTGYQVQNLSDTFYGQYMWIQAAKVMNANKWDAYIKWENEIIEKWILFLQQQVTIRHKNICIWGAGAKGVSFLNLIDPECKYISGIVDINPQKQGCFLSGTGHQIISPEKLGEILPDFIIIMNENYADEIQGTLRILGLERSKCILL